MDDTAQPIWGSYLADFDAILNDQDISNSRTAFEQVVFALIRVLYNLNTSEKTIRFLTEVLDKAASLLAPLDGVADQHTQPQQSFRGSPGRTLELRGSNVEEGRKC